MKNTLRVIAAFLILAIAYLSLWPVPIEPVSWTPPVDRGFVDPFTSNNLLQPATGIDIDPYESPEDATLGRDGIYVSTTVGAVLRIQNGSVTEVAHPGGNPLGIVADKDGSLLLANAYYGLQRILPGGNSGNPGGRS